jgi:ankyrin repeat protein
MSIEQAPLLFSALSKHDAAGLRRSEDSGKNWKTTDKHGQNAMHLVLRLGHSDGIGLLFQHGGPATHADNNGNTPLHYTARHHRGAFPIHQTLAAGGLAGQLNKNSASAVYEVLCQGNREVFQALAAKLDDQTMIGPDKQTLKFAVQRQRPEWLADVPVPGSRGPG